MTNKTLVKLYAEHVGKVSDKWSIYFNEYERIFDNYRDSPIRLLEIGIQNGGSLEIWSKYFPHAQKLVGCDINPDCAGLSYEDPRIAVVVGDANSDAAQAAVLGHAPAFDVIVDDGSHRSSDIVKSFARYFPHLADGGVFIAEDLHCSYWREFEGGLFDPFSSITFFKRLADVISHEHWGIDKNRTDILSGFFSKYGFQIDEETLQHVHSVEFINSICVIRKDKPVRNRLGTRVIVGSVGTVVPGDVLRSTLEKIPDQTDNEWTAHSGPPDEELLLRIKELADHDGQIASLNEAVTERDGQIASLNDAVTERDGQIERILGSTSWKVSAPIRWIGHRIRRARILIACLAPLWHDPRKIPSTVIRVRFAWDRGGMLAVKQLLLRLPMEVSFNDVWLQYRQTFTPDVEVDIRKRIGGMEGRPLISILMPVYNTRERVLRKTIESVLAQLYSDWELCVVDDASSQPEVRRILEEFSARDSRIRVEFSERNGGIARATNRALAVARGSFVALLDHDDVLEKQALFRLAESILADDPDMIYSDEAILSEDGVEVLNHVYRPAFSPERLRSCPYIVHLVAFRTDLLREIGGLDASLAISQDYDLILRASEKARTIVHIPEILYLWRQRKGSAGHKMKEEVMETSRQVLARHLERCGERGEVRDGLLFNYYEVRYPIEPGQRVAIIIPTKNHGELVRQCVDSIERTVSGVPYDIVVIDHASTDPESLAYFRQLSDRHRLLRYEGPFNFSSINNWAVAQLDGEYTHYLFCNNDVETTETGWLERMMELCQKPDVGMVGAKLLYPDGRTFQHAGVCVGMSGIAEHYAKFMDDRLPNGGIHPGYHGTLIANHEVSAVTAACALMRRDAFERIGGFDEAIAVGFGDVDLCLRTLEAGYRILFCPHASLIHHESLTRGKSHEDPHPEDSALFTRKWRKFLDRGDPYFNPNLTLYSTQWEIRQPMEFNPHIGRRVIHRQPATLGLARASRQNTG